MEKFSITEFVNPDPRKNISFPAVCGLTRILMMDLPHNRYGRFPPLQVQGAVLCRPDGRPGPSPGLTDCGPGGRYEKLELNYYVVVDVPDSDKFVPINAGVLFGLLERGPKTFGRVLGKFLRHARSSPLKHLSAEDLPDSLRLESRRDQEENPCPSHPGLNLASKS
ncbi:MAG TPA: hypothetical protein VIY49_34370 [Bryobacteraceae bacterium]